MLPLTLIRNWRLFAFIGAMIAFVIFVYLWRSEIIDSAQNAYIAVTNANTIEVNEQSRKAADNVAREERKITDIDRAICKLGGIMREHESCSGK